MNTTITYRLNKLVKLITSRICAEDFVPPIHTLYIERTINGINDVAVMDAMPRLAWIERAERLAPEADLVKWLGGRHGFVDYMAPHG
jgi:hypothetical protein